MEINKIEKRKEILTVFEQRHATKSFDGSKKIAKEDWETIFEAARLSPSSFGYEPWKFLLIENQEIREGLKEFASGAINSLNGASHFVIALARKNVVFDSDYAKYMVETVFGTTYDINAPQTQIFKEFQQVNFDLNTERSLFDWASKQTYIALGNMMTAAAFLQIDSCPIEGFNREKVEAYLTEHKLLDQSEFGVSYMLGLGYRNAPIPKKRRQKTEDILMIVD